MKKVLILALLVSFCISAVLPPALPSSFYGYVKVPYTNPIVEVWANNVKLAQTGIFLYLGAPVYALNVPMDGIAEGTEAQFKIDGFVTGRGYLYSGTNQQVDLVYISAPVVTPAPAVKKPCVIRNRWAKYPAYCYRH